MPYANYLATFLIITEQKLFEIVGDNWESNEGLMDYMVSREFEALNLDDADAQVEKARKEYKRIREAEQEGWEYLVIPCSLSRKIWPQTRVEPVKKYELSEEVAKIKELIRLDVPMALAS